MHGARICTDDAFVDLLTAEQMHTTTAPARSAGTGDSISPPKAIASKDVVTDPVDDVDGSVPLAVTCLWHAVVGNRRSEARFLKSEVSLHMLRLHAYHARSGKGSTNVNLACYDYSFGETLRELCTTQIACTLWRA